MTHLALLLATLWPLAQPLPDDAVVARARGPHGEIHVTAGRLRAYAQGREGETPKALVTALIELDLLAAEAQRRGLAQDPEVLGALKPILARRYLKARFEPMWSVDTVPQGWIEQAYQRNLRRFKHPRLMKGAHLLIHKDLKFPPLALSEAAEALADQIYQQIKANPPADEAAFEALASTFQPQVEAAGLALRVEALGWFSDQGPMIEPFNHAVFEHTTPGALIPPFPTRFGLHVVRVDDFKPAQDQPLAEVEAEIRQRVLPEVRVAELRAWLKGLKAARALVNAAPLEALEARQQLEVTNPEAQTPR
ncbi:peptidyl-prolyl cis-trans isomerase [Myxococcota bacterium]|nr:peptidyl-prolyl cis-trans isomerase [Myxococcota bacterium]MBU1432895.1 peptidyl-prolyl cis-trans isomerase [Myxococcota bacterium]MBU1900143.1 peptidyl-prolyl cis-trans isomerase [Myxococcota bacterium]